MPDFFLLSPRSLSDLLTTVCLDTVGAESSVLTSVDGQLVSHSDGMDPDNAKMTAGLLSTLWKTQISVAAGSSTSSEMSSMGEMRYLLVANDGGLLGLARSGNYLVSLRAKPTAHLGMIKLKLKELAKAIEEPLTVATDAAGTT